MARMLPAEICFLAKHIVLQHDTHMNHVRDISASIPDFLLAGAHTYRACADTVLYGTIIIIISWRWAS